MQPFSDMSFNTASESDFEELLALRIEAMRDSLERIGRFDPARARERFRTGFSPADTRHIVVDGVRAGFVVVKRQDGQLLLDHLYIRPSCQHRGIGAKVLETIFADADMQRLSVRVGALKGSDSNRFYVRHGFRKIGEDEWDIYYVRECSE
jgi:ribosomal protein S18 acetylase RimI-like enzyme